MTLHAVASKYLQAGLSCIPTDTHKRPAISSWDAYKAMMPTEAEWQSWEGAEGIGVICGSISGNLVCIDVDAKYDLTGGLLREYCELVDGTAPDLLSRLVVQQTPNGGGRHFIFRAPYPVPTVKLASRATTEEERVKSPKEKVKVLIETRGEGGYFCAAPTPGYRFSQNDLSGIPCLNEEETEIMLACARAMNLLQEEPVAPKISVPNTAPLSGLSPLDAYDQRTNPDDIAQLLVHHGWRIMRRRGDAYYLQRPGKDKSDRGLSATWNHIPGRFYVFSTSTEFEAGKVYKGYAVYAMLEHSGDFAKAASALYHQGYGDRHEKPAPAVTLAPLQEPQKVSICPLDPWEADVYALYDKGHKKGASSGWPIVDPYYSVVRGQLNIVTGIPSHGKSEWVDALTMNLAMAEDWRFIYLSPENFPPELHAQKLIEKYIGKPMMGLRRMSRQELTKGMEFIKAHFLFVDATETDVTLESFLSEVEAVTKTQKIDGVVIDPWNELESGRPRELTETEYIGKCLMDTRKFARRLNIAIWIVAHPQKMRKDPKTGEYPLPSMYDINGSANWYNKADNGIVVWRDFSDNHTEVHFQKIKFKYYGRVGVVQMRYDLDSGRYHPWETADTFALPQIQPPPMPSAKRPQWTERDREDEEGPQF